VGSAGPGCNNHCRRELVFTIRVGRPSGVSTILCSTGSRPTGGRPVLETVEDSQARQLRQMPLFLLFPDDLERIFGAGDRRAVAIEFWRLTPGRYQRPMQRGTLNRRALPSMHATTWGTHITATSSSSVSPLRDRRVAVGHDVIMHSVQPGIPSHDAKTGEVP
jgi:hypothetical protein